MYHSVNCARFKIVYESHLGVCLSLVAVIPYLSRLLKSMPSELCYVQSPTNFKKLTNIPIAR